MLPEALRARLESCAACGHAELLMLRRHSGGRGVQSERTRCRAGLAADVMRCMMQVVRLCAHHTQPLKTAAASRHKQLGLWLQLQSRGRVAKGGLL